MSHIWKANKSGLHAAAQRLAGGHLLGVPTETVYGLAADATNENAVAAIYETKGRPRFNPLIVHVRAVEDADRLAHLTPGAKKLMDAFWPGPLTLVLAKRPDAEIAQLVSAGLDTLALRSPAHPVAQALLDAFGRPFVAPSANRSGRMSPTCADHVIEEFGDRVPVLDGGPCTAGVESTIVAVGPEHAAILRPGPITAGQIEAILGHPLSQPTKGIQAPGMMTSHYAPNAPLRLNATSVKDTERWLGFGGTKGADLDLSPSGNLTEAAAHLFAYLRRLDATPGPIAVAPIPHEGLGIAINDRLTRAAAPREAPRK